MGTAVVPLFSWDRSDFPPDWTLSNLLVTCIFSSFFFFFFFIILGNWVGQLKFSRHYFFSFFFLIFFCLLTISRGMVVKSDKKLLTSSVWFPRLNSSKTFSSLFCFVFFYLWHNWIFLNQIAEYFSSLFCFFLLFF